ncbi:MAG: radical SAM protein [Clostridia bacterium]|nr:radical SAM protein [Clostridia bacterium]
MEFVKAKTIISKVNYGDKWYGVLYNMNLYRGCCHGCIYCDSRSNCYHVENFDTVRSKENAIAILEQELYSKREKGVIGIGSMSDPYNPFEKEYEITRKALELVAKYQYGISITTKSDLIVRDVDLLKKINEKNDVIVAFTITTADDAISKVIEPNVSISSERFRAIRELTSNGIYTGIMMSPVLPYITDNKDNIKEIVRLAYENGANFIYTYMGMTLRENQRDYYYDKLEKHFKGLKQKYMTRYGDQYNCTVPGYRELYQLFTTECDKYGIVYTMKDIISGYQKKKNRYEQITLFE